MCRHSFLEWLMGFRGVVKLGSFSDWGQEGKCLPTCLPVIVVVILDADMWWIMMGQWREHAQRGGKAMNSDVAAVTHRSDVGRDSKVTQNRIWLHAICACTRSWKRNLSWKKRFGTLWAAAWTQPLSLQLNIYCLKWGALPLCEQPAHRCERELLSCYALPIFHIFPALANHHFRRPAAVFRTEPIFLHFPAPQRGFWDLWIRYENSFWATGTSGGKSMQCSPCNLIKDTDLLHTDRPY